MKLNIRNKQYENIIFAAVLMLLTAFSGCASTPAENDVADRGDSSLSDVKEKGVLVVGSSEGLEPMEFINTAGEFEGLEVDIVKEIASMLDLDLEILLLDWWDLFEAVEEGEVDLIIGSITINSERSEKVLFSAPYVIGGQVVAILKDNDEIKSHSDLKDKKVGVLESTVAEDAARKYLNFSTIITYEDGDDFINDFMIGEIDAVVGGYVFSSAFMKNNNAKLIGEPITNEFYGLAAKPGNDALMDEVNKVLREMKRTGKLKQLEDKWLR